MNTHNIPHGGGPPTESESLKNAWQQENLKKIREALNIAFIEKKKQLKLINLYKKS